MKVKQLSGFNKPPAAGFQIRREKINSEALTKEPWVRSICEDAAGVVNIDFADAETGLHIILESKKLDLTGFGENSGEAHEWTDIIQTK